MQLKSIGLNYGKEKYAIYTGRTSPHFHPVISGITYPDPSYKICRPTGEDIYVFEYVISGKGYVRHGSEEFTVQEGDAYILYAGVPQYYYADKNDPWKKIWFNVGGTLVRHMLTDYDLDQVLKVPDYNHYLSLRFDLAKTMLKRTTLSIQEISDRMGFIDYHHFSNFFKKRCGISPSDYRSSRQ